MANIELPKDARGHEIPLDAKHVYTRHGKALDVIGFCLMETDRGTREWTVWTKVAKYRPEDVLVNRTKKPTVIVDNSRYDSGTYFVGCLWCGARSDYEHGEENAAELWNGRVNDEVGE